LEARKIQEHSYGAGVLYVLALKIRVRDAFAIFSNINFPVAFSMRLVVLKNFSISSATTAATILVAAAVPRTSFVLTFELRF
jgi:hypothetical protein